MEEHIDFSTPQSRGAVDWIKSLTRNSPWVVISVMAHVIIIAIFAVVVMSGHGATEDTVVMSMGTTASKRDEAKKEDEPPPELIDRKAVPVFQNTDALEVTNEDDVFITADEQMPDDPVHNTKEIGDPNQISNLSNMGTTGGTAIGVAGAGHYGTGVPSTVGGWKLGGGKFGNRFGGKGKAIGNKGATAAPAIADGLEWLKNHQDDDGSWDAANFMKHDTKGDPCDGPGNPVNNVGITALALLAFLGDGNTMREGTHRGVVRKAVKWLQDQQDMETGLIGTDASHEYMYSHAIATLAMCEAYGLSGYKPIQKNAQKAINYVQNARNPYKVWRYYPRNGDNDTSVTGWMVLALKSAEEFKLQVDKDALKHAALWFEEVTDPSTGQCGYLKRGDGSSRKETDKDKYPASKTEAMTAVGLLCRFFLGQDPKQTPVMSAAAATMLKKPPVWNPNDGSIDTYYWYYASFAMYQMGGDVWDQWSKKMLEAVVKPQRHDNNFKGSWDPVGVWADDGGRVYQTAILVLCLEAYYRYARILGGR